MRKPINYVLSFLTASIVILAPPIILSQNNLIEQYQFISPNPGSSFHHPETNIVLRQGDELIYSEVAEKKIIEVTGSISGSHTGSLILAGDKKTLLFKPDSPFKLGEEVFVNVNSFKTAAGNEVLPGRFSFFISERIPPEKTASFFINQTVSANHIKIENKHRTSEKIKDDLPEDFPEITVKHSDNPADGYVFLSPFRWPLTNGYLIISDNSGVPVFYKRTPASAFDFKLQPNGMLSYHDLGRGKFFVLDSSYTIADSLNCVNGYQTDMHELQILTDNHSLLMSYDPQFVRMDTVVQGGDSSAIVFGLVIQELDENKNLVFQWRSWDHFLITDATDDIDLTAHTIDYVHGNAIELDNDGNLLISSRHMDEITKIDRQTGDIIWRLGGLNARNNQFLFVNDPVTFSHQHDIRRLPNGNITLFDNGNLHNHLVSSAVEYQLDEVNKIAELVWRYKHDPESYFFAMGNAQRLDNNNTMVGWGWSYLYPEDATEVKPDGSVAFELNLPDSVLNYRAFRFPWRTNLFTFEEDNIFFESVPVGDSLIITTHLKNNSSSALTITGFYNKDSSFKILHDEQFTIPPLAAEQIDVKFKPVKEGIFFDTLHVRSDTEDSRIAQLLIMGGRTDTTFTSIRDEDNIIYKYNLSQNYPNPFNPITKINYSLAKYSLVTIIIYDLLGREVVRLVNEEKPAGHYSAKFNASGLPSGVYIYKMQAGNFIANKKLILLK